MNFSTRASYRIDSAKPSSPHTPLFHQVLLITLHRETGRHHPLSDADKPANDDYQLIMRNLKLTYPK
jgi:hypothetical protein